MIKPLWRRVLGLLQIPLWWLLQYIPKQKNIWVFGAWNGQKFADNAKYIFLHVLQNHPDIQAVWIVKSKDLLLRLQAEDLPVAYAYSAKGLWLQMRAGCVVFSHSVEWDLVSWCVGGKVFRLQGWHGLPMKNIGYLDQKGVTRNRAQMIGRLYPHRTDRCDFIPAAGQFDQSIFQAAFNVASDDVEIVGYPRFDSLHKTGTSNTFIYMPTLRGTAGTIFDLFAKTALDFQLLDQHLKQIDRQLFIKLHPVQAWDINDRAICDTCDNIHILSPDYDVIGRIDQFQGVITDVSSVFFDFLFLEKPIITAQFDMDDFFATTRTLIDTLPDTDVGFSAQNWEDIVHHMESIPSQSPFAPPPSYTAVRKQFFTHFDTHASHRVVTEVRKRLG